MGVLLILASCSKKTDENNNPTSQIPVLSTATLNNITQTTAISGGNITSQGSSSVTARGVCWSTITNPTISDAHSTDGNGTGNFTSNLAGLSSNTLYYVRAYATNSAGTGYGNLQSFTTQQGTGTVPTVTTNSVTNITQNTATCGGNVTTDGGSIVTARGICFSISANPTISDTHTSDSSGIGNFISNMNGLSQNTIYYVRAYATNSAGTGYGNQQSFTTQGTGGTVTDIDGNVYHIITIGTQVWIVENLKTTKFNDGTVIPIVTDNTAWSNLTTPGYCWYNNDAATYKDPYGALYNGYAVHTGKLAPSGWHVPTRTEWTTLINYLGGEGLAGGKIKEADTVHWNSPNAGATNESGFTALPGGSRKSGTFNYIGQGCYLWSTTEYVPKDYWYCSLSFQLWGAYLNNGGWTGDGYSVRCVRN